MIHRTSHFLCLFLLLEITNFSLILAQSENMVLQGSIRLANSQVPSPEPGTIRWSGCDLEGWNGAKWVSLTSGTESRGFGQALGGECNDFSTDLAYDQVGNVFIAGYFSCTAFLGHITLNSFGSFDAFVAKISSDGVVQWAVSGGGTGFDQCDAIVVDPFGDVIVTGSFSNSGTFSNTAISGQGLSDAFVVKYTSSGQLLWIKPPEVLGTMLDKPSSLMLWETFMLQVCISRPDTLETLV